MKHLEEAEDEQYEVLSYEEEKYGRDADELQCDFAGLRYHRADIYLFPFLAGRSIGKRARRIPGNLCSVLYLTFFSMAIIRCVIVKMVQAAHPEKRGDMNYKNFQERLDGQAAMRQEKEMVYQE